MQPIGLQKSIHFVFPVSEEKSIIKKKNLQRKLEEILKNIFAHSKSSAIYSPYNNIPGTFVPVLRLFQSGWVPVRGLI